MILWLKKITTRFWSSLLRNRPSNPFHDLKRRLQEEENRKRMEEQKAVRRCQSLFRQWNRPVRRLLYQLADALGESAKWRGQNLFVGPLSPTGNPPTPAGWRLFWICGYGPAHHSTQMVESVDLVRITFRRDDKGVPNAFAVFTEESGRQLTTQTLSREELVAALKELFP